METIVPCTSNVSASLRHHTPPRERKRFKAPRPRSGGAQPVTSVRERCPRARRAVSERARPTPRDSPRGGDWHGGCVAGQERPSHQPGEGGDDAGHRVAPSRRRHRDEGEQRRDDGDGGRARPSARFAPRRWRRPRSADCLRRVARLEAPLASGVIRGPAMMTGQIAGGAHSPWPSPAGRQVHGLVSQRRPRSHPTALA